MERVGGKRKVEGEEGQSEKKIYVYGNMPGYYGYRTKAKGSLRDRLMEAVSKDDDESWEKGVKEGFLAGDRRLDALVHAKMEGVRVLDIGCNIGLFSLDIFLRYRPSTLFGTDIDGSLVRRARGAKRVMMEVLNEKRGSDFGLDDGCLFRSDNFLSSDHPIGTFEVALCLSITKWIHFNWGDRGLQRFFKKIHSCLSEGGRVVVEPQPWSTYAKKSKLTPIIKHNVASAKVRPEDFPTLLLQEEWGPFKKVEPIQEEAGKGFDRPMFIAYK